MTRIFIKPALAFAALMSLLLTASCYTPRKATRQVTKAQSRFPEIVAAGCAAWYPVRRMDSTRVEYRQGETVINTAWVTVDCDSVERVAKTGHNPARSGNTSNASTRLVRVPCPPSTHRTDTITETRWRVEESTAALAQKDTTIARLNAALTQSKGEVVKARSGRNAWRIVALIALSFILLNLAVRIWLPKLLS